MSCNQNIVFIQSLTIPRQPRSAVKSQPKPATSTKNGAARPRGRRAARGRNAGRGKPKSVEELDAEMQDYYDTGANGASAGGDAATETNGGAVQPATGDTGMDDEILVSTNFTRLLEC